MKQPIYVPKNQKAAVSSPDFEWKLKPQEGYFPVFIVDTEGLSAVDQDENHDTRIFLLAVLLSSLMIFNSVGTIDENALNNLSLVVNLSKTIQVRHVGDNDPDELASHFPSFLWVLRDFMLRLEDDNENEITAK